MLILEITVVSIAINGGDIFGKASVARAEWNIAVQKENKAIQDILAYVEGEESSHAIVPKESTPQLFRYATINYTGSDTEWDQIINIENANIPSTTQIVYNYGQ